jgi:O-antigen/teichoic acid export membrane protein
MLLTPLRSLQISQLFRLGVIFLISVILARTISDKSTIADYEKLILIGSSFTFFWVSGLINVFVPFYNTVSDEKKDEVIFNIFILLSFLSLFSCGLIYLLKETLYKGNQEYFYLYLGFILFNSPALIIEYILLVRNKSKNLLSYGSITGIIHFICFLIPLKLGYGLYFSLSALLALGIVKYFLFATIAIKNKAFRIDKELLIEISHKTLPTMLSLLLGGSMIYVDSYMADYFFSKPEFALYQYGARELPFVLLFANSLSSFASGKIAESVSKNSLSNQLLYLKESSRKLMYVFFPISILLLLFSNTLFSIVYGNSFSESVPVFRIHLLLIISRLIFPQTILLGLHKNNYLLKASVLEVVVNFSLNLIFIYYLGIIGIAISTVIAYLIEKIYHTMVLKKIGISPEKYIPLKIWLIFSTCLIIAFAVLEFLEK